MITFRPDWLQFSVSQPDISVFQGFGLKPIESGGAFHQKGLRGPGIQVNYDPKPNVKNWAMEVKITGQFFVLCPEGAGAIWESFKALGYELKISRIDYCYDIIGTYGHSLPFGIFRDDFVVKEFYRRAFFKSYDNIDGRWTGLRLGKNDVALRIYDKLEETGLENSPGLFTEWWRLIVTGKL